MRLTPNYDTDFSGDHVGGTCNCSEGCEKSNAGPWKEGRAERRERWLKGEGSAGVTVKPGVLSGGMRGTAEEDEEERQRAEQQQQQPQPHSQLANALSHFSSRQPSRRSSKRSSKSSNSNPLNITSREDEREGDEELEASSQSTQASTPGPSTPPLDLSSDMNGLSISSSSEERSEGLRGEEVTPTMPGLGKGSEEEVRREDVGAQGVSEGLVVV